ncbi:glycosyltransferase family 2 protein [Ideonella livida]|uniref:Glycosyltransferase family 2 protein n=1 Tax=Ideonella livida TaxID=2707176 RepID=A0A7C9PGW9_9BURK|nr:glycosyltransferase family 2 protein [Ideonella livida]NDY91092.1 glycosyltransferase family 2 protein [Ideonella livida]
MTPLHRPLTVLLVSYNTRDLLTPCLDALKQALQPFPDARVVVVDNASRDGSAAYLRQHHPEVRLLESGTNVGFGRANNLALPEVADGDLLLLNTDAFVPAEAVSRALSCLQREADVGIVGVRLVGRDGSQQPSCRGFPSPLGEFLARTGLATWFPTVRQVDDRHWRPERSADCDWVPGCFYLIRREVLRQVGLFDPRFFLYYEEVDHCRRVRQAGWRVHYLAEVAVVHLGGESAKSDGEITSAGRQSRRLQLESALLYYRKHGGLTTVLGWSLLQVLWLVLVGAGALIRGRWSRASAAGAEWRLAMAILWATRAGGRALH